ncbi:MAG: methionyl-tRNA formyltransferase [Planctomycetota bacterium]|nr:methionyl-tRNA formyltransferase [Planctomycetota bacterium]
MRVIFFGSGPFGLPSLQQLTRHHEVALVVTQPDRPAGRKRTLQMTPIGAFAGENGLEIIKPENVNVEKIRDQIHEVRADAFVVIAFGQKLGPELLGNSFAINLHASLLPKFRGAAPINWAMMHGETTTGVSVITLAQRMDAGDVLASGSTRIDPCETAGELHDRLADLGPALVLEVLQQFEQGKLEPATQDESLVSLAPKMSKEIGTVRFDQPSSQVRARIHGLTPWPGCTVHLGDERLKLLRVKDHEDRDSDSEPGVLLDDCTIACGSGRLELLSVQASGGKAMTFQAYLQGHQVPPGARFTSK